MSSPFRSNRSSSLLIVLTQISPSSSQNVKACKEEGKLYSISRLISLETYIVCNNWTATASTSSNWRRATVQRIKSWWPKCKQSMRKWCKDRRTLARSLYASLRTESLPSNNLDQARSKRFTMEPTHTGMHFMLERKFTAARLDGSHNVLTDYWMKRGESIVSPLLVRITVLHRCWWDGCSLTRSVIKRNKKKREIGWRLLLLAGWLAGCLYIDC